jgi:hypothetical protein
MNIAMEPTPFLHKTGSILQMTENGAFLIKIMVSLEG